MSLDKVEFLTRSSISSATPSPRFSTCSSDRLPIRSTTRADNAGRPFPRTVSQPVPLAAPRQAPVHSGATPVSRSAARPASPPPKSARPVSVDVVNSRLRSVRQGGKLVPYKRPSSSSTNASTHRAISNHAADVPVLPTRESIVRPFQVSPMSP
jgi:hypothetical protein